MTTKDKHYDIVAVSAICVDIRIESTDEVLEKHGLKKGLSTPVSAKKLQEILSSGGENLRLPGSAGGNVAAGIALRDGKAAMIGKIANDNDGKFFADRAKAHGIDYTPVLSTNKDTPTTCVAALITPDKERSFAFVSGAGTELAPEDVDHKLIVKAKITYLDSYLWLTETGKDTVHHAVGLARDHGSKVAIALNGANVVEQHQAAFRALIKKGDILVGDQQEFASLLGTKTFEETVQELHKLGVTASITAGAKGAYIVDAGQQHFIPSNKVEKIVDTNGAGDQFAAGFLYGLASGKSVVEAGRQGASWAAAVIQHAGSVPRIGKNAPQAKTSAQKLRA